MLENNSKPGIGIKPFSYGKKEKESYRVLDAARRIEQHIRCNGYSYGDHYLTSHEVAMVLEETSELAHRAMAYLAKKKVLKRRKRVGSFIGEGFKKVEEQVALCIYFLISQELLDEVGFQERFEGYIRGMQKELPNLAVQFMYIPHHDLAQAKKIVDQYGKEIGGVGLIFSSRKLRAYFNQSGIPTVVFGSYEADLSNLCFIGIDQKQTGRILTSHLLDKGHQRIAVLMRDVWSTGEHHLHDGIVEEMMQRGLPVNALLVRSSSADKSGVNEIAEDLLLPPGRPGGVICRTIFQADCVQEVVDKMSLTDTIDVTVCNTDSTRKICRYATARPDLNAEGIGRIAGIMYKDMQRRQEPEDRGISLPVRLHLPSSS